MTYVLSGLSFFLKSWSYKSLGH